MDSNLNELELQGDVEQQPCGGAAGPRWRAQPGSLRVSSHRLQVGVLLYPNDKVPLCHRVA